MSRFLTFLLLLVVICLLIVPATASEPIPQRKRFDGKLLGDLKVVVDGHQENHTRVVIQADADGKTHVLYLRKGVSRAPDFVRDGQRVRIVWWHDTFQDKFIIDDLEVLNSR
jgi:hypothetical protein